MGRKSGGGGDGETVVGCCIRVKEEEGTGKGTSAVVFEAASRQKSGICWKNIHLVAH